MSERCPLCGHDYPDFLINDHLEREHSMSEFQRQLIFKNMLSIMHPAHIDRWLHTENPSLGYMTPSYLIRNGRSDHVWDLVEALKTGAFL